MAIDRPKKVQLPWGDDLSSFVSGEKLLLSGTVFAARDRTHHRLIEAMERGGPVPIRLAGATIFYAGPAPAPGGGVVGAVGPTTSKRMDVYTRQMLSAGVRAVIGKGTRSPDVRQAFVDFGSLYLIAVGGTAALLSTRVTDAGIVAYEDLGPEALYRLELEDFPVYVAIDCAGNDLLESEPKKWSRRRK